MATVGDSFVRANLARADFHNVSFGRGFFLESDLPGARFQGATGLESFWWWDTICPDGTNSDDNGGTCLGHLTGGLARLA